MKLIFCISLLFLIQNVHAQSWFNKDFSFRLYKQNNQAFCSFDAQKWEKLQSKDTLGLTKFYNKSRNFTVQFLENEWVYSEKNHTVHFVLAMHPREDLDTTKNMAFWKGSLFSGNYIRNDRKEILTIDFRTIQYQAKGGKWKQLRAPKYDLKSYNIKGLAEDGSTITIQMSFPSCEIENFERVTGTFPPEDFNDNTTSEPDEPGYNGGGYEEKPVTYFYSKDSKNVLFDVKTKLVKTIPEPDEQGWELFLKNNKMYHKENEIPNVFWEGKTPQVRLQTNEGWLIETKNLGQFFRDNMTEMGFQKHEIDECVDYWQNRFQKKYVEIYLAFVKQDKNHQESNANGAHYQMDFPETIEPQPDHLFRISYYFRETNELKNLNTPIVPKMNRTGFYIVEWGGMDISQLSSKILIEN